jgi:hypothetical protein
VTFMVEGGAMRAHSLVLVARCDYFRTMLGAGMQVGVVGPSHQASAWEWLGPGPPVTSAAQSL